MFPSELFRYFEKEVTRKTLPQSRNYGKVICSTCPSNDFELEFQKSSSKIDTKIDSRNRSPILIPINKSLFVVATRNQFQIYLDTITEREAKSGFFKEAQRQNSVSSTRYLQVASGTLPSSDGEIHCGCFIKFDSNREFLFLGGRRNVGL